MPSEQVKSRFIQVDLLNTVTKAEYAREIQKSQTTVQNMINDKLLKTVKISTVTFVIKP